VINILFATAVGALFATGAYLILRRQPIKLILGLGLLTHGVNLLIFSTSAVKEAAPPIIPDKATFTGDITPFVDPLPQALILTAIVISFGVTAFIVMLINRRHTLINESRGAASSTDPFAPYEHYASGLDRHPDDYEWLGYALDEKKALRKNDSAENGSKNGNAENDDDGESGRNNARENANNSNDDASEDETNGGASHE
jgi:multicomponent Na+:H+ antiporter subunit C